MKQMIDKINIIIEAICDFLIAVLIIFTFILFLSPYFNLDRALITIALIVVLFLIIAFCLEYVFDILDKIRKGELLAWFIKPLRNISSVIGFYGVIKAAYFIVHSDKAPSASSIKTFLWDFLTKF